MYITPNTTIRLLHNVPVEPSYNHTIYFDSEAKQTAYFITKQKRSFPKNTYQRHTRDTMKVAVLADDIYDCNYLMFQNTAYGNKWFYAFITSIEYVNNVTSLITYQIDVLQSWLFDFTLGQCFVERQHSTSDGYFENLVPENLDLGDYTIEKTTKVELNNMSVGMYYTQRSDGTSADSKSYGKIFSGLGLESGIPATDAGSIANEIKAWIDNGKEDALVSVFQYPSFLDTPDDSSEPYGGLHQKTVPVYNNITQIDGYEPKNRKLFSYPYCKLVLTNNAGSRAEYRWEQFKYSSASQSLVNFKLAGAIVTTPTVTLYPLEYMGMDANYDRGLVLSNFPTVAWSGDAWKAWWAQNKGSVTSSMIASAMTTMTAAGTSAIAGNLTSAGTTAVMGQQNLFNQAQGIMGKKQDLENTPPQVHGQVQCDSLNAQMSKVQFTFEHQTVRAPFAKLIDDFFTMFGYAQNCLMVPNLHARPHWTYIKTVACVLTGSIPADDSEFIVNIFNNGITWWMNGDEVGDYSLDNRPT
nr:MAG TPA: Major tail protein [Caudoviricetes sp.]